MTENKGTQTMYTKPLAMTGTGILALALLTGCTTADPDADATPAGDGAATATTAPAETSPAAGTASPGDDDADDQGTSSAPATTGSAPAAAGEDPVFAAIDALYAEHQDAIIVEIDQDDDDTVYEIEAVVGDRILDFDVMTDGSVREDDDEDDDDDDIRKAREATVTAEQAAQAALEGRDGQTIDSMELDEDDNALHWEIELDDDQGRDGDELRVDAMTGEVRPD